MHLACARAVIKGNNYFNLISTHLEWKFNLVFTPRTRRAALSKAAAASACVCASQAGNSNDNQESGDVQCFAHIIRSQFTFAYQQSVFRIES